MPIPEQVREDIVQALFQSTESSTNLARSMTTPLLDMMNRTSFARQVLHVQPLPEGAIPVYSDDQISMPETRISATRSFTYQDHSFICKDQLTAEFDIMNQVRKIKEDEDKCLKKLFEEVNNNLIEEFNDIFIGIDKLASKDIDPSLIIMNVKTYAKFAHSQKIGMNSSTNSDMNFLGVKIQVSNLCNDNEIFMLGKPEHIGTIPVIQDLTCSSMDRPEETGFLFFETIGMTINPDSVVKMKIDTRNEEEKERAVFEEKMKKIRRYRYISSRK